jgi:hypothetical protein
MGVRLGTFAVATLASGCLTRATTSSLAFGRGNSHIGSSGFSLGTVAMAAFRRSGLTGTTGCTLTLRRGDGRIRSARGFRLGIHFSGAAGFTRFCVTLGTSGLFDLGGILLGRSCLGGLVMARQIPCWNRSTWNEGNGYHARGRCR